MSAPKPKRPEQSQSGGWSPSFAEQAVSRIHRVAVGDRVVVLHGSGVDSGRQGIILDNSVARLVNRQANGQYGEPGRYKDFDPSTEVLIRDDQGKVFGMFQNRVRRVDSPEGKAEIAWSQPAAQTTASEAAAPVDLTGDQDLGFLSGAQVGEWKEMNGIIGLDSRSGTWACRVGEDAIHIVDFAPTQDGRWHLRMGTCGTHEMAEYAGWKLEHENAINGHQVLATRAELDEALKGLIPQKAEA